MVIALSAGDHTYVGVSAYCFLKPAVLLKPNKHKESLLCEIFVRSGNLENNHSAESLWVDVTVVPQRFRNVSTLAGSTIATFALLLSCGSDAADQHISGLSNTPAGGRIDRREVSGACLQSNRHAATSQNTAVVTFWVTEMHFCFTPFRCKFKSALIQSASPSSRRWYLVVKTASVQFKDVFTDHTDTFHYTINSCPAPTATLAFSVSATTQPPIDNVEVHGQRRLQGL